MGVINSGCSTGTHRNKALARMAEVEDKIAAHDAAKVAPIADPASLATLAADLKTVWTTPSTDARLKKRIVRTVIHEVIADIDPEAAEIVLVVHWIGGVHSEIRLPRRRRGQRNSTSVDVIAAVRQLVLIANEGDAASGVRPALGHSLPNSRDALNICCAMNSSREAFGEGSGRSHSITSSARAESMGGTSTLNALAVLRLMTNSNFVVCTAGRSAGLAPLRIRPTYTPA
jgi:hypothetical protein